MQDAEITDLIVLGRNYWSSCRVLCEFQVCALLAELMEVDRMEASQRYFQLPLLKKKKMYKFDTIFSTPA